MSSDSPPPPPPLPSSSSPNLQDRSTYFLPKSGIKTEEEFAYLLSAAIKELDSMKEVVVVHEQGGSQMGIEKAIIVEEVEGVAVNNGGSSHSSQMSINVEMEERKLSEGEQDVDGSASPEQELTQQVQDTPAAEKAVTPATDIQALPAAAAPPRGRGRPPGTKNRPREQIAESKRIREEKRRLKQGNNNSSTNNNSNNNNNNNNQATSMGQNQSAPVGGTENNNMQIANAPPAIAPRKPRGRPRKVPLVSAHPAPPQSSNAKGKKRASEEPLRPDTTQSKKSMLTHRKSVSELYEGDGTGTYLVKGVQRTIKKNNEGFYYEEGGIFYFVKKNEGGDYAETGDTDCAYEEVDDGDLEGEYGLSSLSLNNGGNGNAFIQNAGGNGFQQDRFDQQQPIIKQDYSHLAGGDELGHLLDRRIPLLEDYPEPIEEPTTPYAPYTVTSSRYNTTLPLNEYLALQESQIQHSVRPAPPKVFRAVDGKLEETRLPVLRGPFYNYEEPKGFTQEKTKEEANENGQEEHAFQLKGSDGDIYDSFMDLLNAE